MLLFLTIPYLSAISQTEHLTIKDLYTDLVNSLRTEDDADLLAFCNRVVMDEETLNFMREQNMCHKGVPCRLDERGESIDYVANKYYQELLYIKRSLEYEGLLEDLELAENQDFKFETERIPAVLDFRKNKTRIISYRQLNVLQKALKKSDSLSTADPKLKDKNLNDYLKIVDVSIRGTDQAFELKSGKVQVFYSMGEVASVFEKKWSLVTIPNSSISIVR